MSPSLPLYQIMILAVIQGIAELLPISSSAHVIVAEKLMGLDPSTPEMTFLLVMLHTGTMVSVLYYFWPRWKKLTRVFLNRLLIATAVTGVVGISLKIFIEKLILERVLGESHGEVERLFKSLPLMSCSLFSVGVLITYAGFKSRKKQENRAMSASDAIHIGAVQGLCLPFRGFSRSGATISAALLSKISEKTAEEFSFALAVVLTPPIIILELVRLLRTLKMGGEEASAAVSGALFAGFIGMFFSFAAGIFALRWLTVWLEGHRWQYFGIYCMVASLGVYLLGRGGF